MQRLTTPARRGATLARARVVFGVPSTLVVAGFVLSQSLVSIILGLLPTWQAHLAWLAVCAVIALLAFRRWDRQVTDTLMTAHLGQAGTDRLTHRRGVVLILGLESAATTSSVAKLLAAATSLEYLALIGTPETQTRKVAPEVLGTLAPSLGRHIPAAQVRIFEQGNNAESVSDFVQATTDALAWMVRQGLEPHEIVVDTSDGRRAMGYGALVAAEHAGVEAQYLSLAWDPMHNRPVPGVEQFKVVREIPALKL